MAKEEKTKVTRISAGDDSRPTAMKPATPAAKTKPGKIAKKKRSYGLLGKIGGYFKGAWVELRQVHWPTRQATWGLTGAVLIFSAFFGIFITLLDVGFKFMFEQILK